MAKVGKVYIRILITRDPQHARIDLFYGTYYLADSCGSNANIYAPFTVIYLKVAPLLFWAHSSMTNFGSKLFWL